MDETLRNLPDPRSQRTTFYRNPNERPWSARRIGVVNEIMFNRVDLIGMSKMKV